MHLVKLGRVEAMQPYVWRWHNAARAQTVIAGAGPDRSVVGVGQAHSVPDFGADEAVLDTHLPHRGADADANAAADDSAISEAHPVRYVRLGCVEQLPQNVWVR